MRDVIAVRENEAAQLVIRERNRIVELCACKEFRYLGAVLVTAGIETNDLNIVSSVFCE